MADPARTERDLPDPLELAQWASALFRAPPGSVEAAPAEVSALAPAAAIPRPEPTSFGPTSASGVGLSPAGANPAGLSPGAYPAAPLPGVRPEVASGPLPAPDLPAPGLDVAQWSTDLRPSAPPGDFGGELYLVAEAQLRRLAPVQALQDDWLTPKSDKAAGGQDLARILAAIEPSVLQAPQADETKVDDRLNIAGGGYPAFDVQAVRRDFPILSEKIHGRPLVWLDNGATTHKPQVVIDRIAHFYAHENSNVHRAAHTLAARATDAYENARKTVARFIGAGSPEEIVFTRGATEAINLVAQAWGRQHIKAGDEIIVSHLEHHANIVPWQQLAQEKGARLRVIPVDDDGQVLLDAYELLLSDRTKIVAVTHISNVLGTVVPIEAIIARAHAYGAKVLIDAAQSIAHARIDVQALDADFLVFSGHKVFAPTGIGVLYGKRAILATTQPWQGGGNMIADVTFEKTLYRGPPARFEAGTGSFADAAGLAAALEYLERIGLENIARHEHDLLDYATAALRTIPGLTLFGSAKEKISVLSFLLEGFAPDEVGAALDRYGVAVRAGHHCAQPILRRFGVEGSVRASLALYNTQEDVDCLVSALRQIAASRGGARPGQ